MKSALDSRPALRDDLTIVRREQRGDVHFVVKEPDRQKYYRFGEAEVALMRLMDGERTPEEIDEAAARELGVRPGAGRIADFAHRLKRMGLVERTPAEKNLMLMERVRSRRKVRARGRVQGSLLRLRVSLGDPDRLFDRWIGPLSWFWSPAFVVLSSVLFLVYVGILTARWDTVVSGTANLLTFSGFGAGDWILFYGIFVVVAAIHELGHGLTTKWFGGEVHEIGVMLLYFSPALFCNTNDAWTFKRRSERLWVTFAGPWIQLVIAALAAVVWVGTQPDTFVHRFAFLTVLVGGVSSVLANFNPLLPLDGYYALSDWLEVPNLRGRAFDYWGWLFKRYGLQMDVARPKTTPRERRIFLVYGGLALLYSVVIGVVSLVWLIMVVGRFIGPWVWAILAYIVLRILYRRSGRIRSIIRAAATTWGARIRENRKLAYGAGGSFVLIVLVLLLPWTFRADGRFVVESTPRIQVRASVPGVLGGISVQEGQRVREGERLATLWNPEIQSRFLEARSELEALRVRRTRAEASGDRGTAGEIRARTERLQDKVELLRARREALAVRAPRAGVVLSSHLDERIGEHLAEGELVLEMAAAGPRLARVRIPLKEAGRIEEGQPVGLKLSARPDLTFRSRVASVAPAARAGSVLVNVPLPEARWEPATGLTGQAKVVTHEGMVGGALLRAFRRTLRLDLWL